MTDILGIEQPTEEQPAQTFDLSSSAPPVTATEALTQHFITGEDSTPQPAGNNAPVAEISAPTQEPESQVDAVLEALMGAIAPAHTATKHVKIFVYGQEGCGKTVFAAQSPGALLADCDKEGAISLLNFDSLKNTKTMPVRSIFAVEKLIQYLKAGVPQFDWVETLIIDPFDDLVYRGLSEQVRGNQTVGLNNTERQNQFLAEGYDYNVNTERFHQMMDEIKALDRHVILTAHTTEKEDKSTGRILIRSNITPKLATIIGGAVSLVGYMKYNSETNERTLTTAPTPTVAAKTRLNLPPVIVNPSFNTILDAFSKMKETESNV